MYRVNCIFIHTCMHTYIHAYNFAEASHPVQVWTFEQIAESFLIYGAKKFYKPGTGPDPLTQRFDARLAAL